MHKYSEITAKLSSHSSVSGNPKPATAVVGSEKTTAPDSVSGPAFMSTARMMAALFSVSETMRITSFSSAMEIL